MPADARVERAGAIGRTRLAWPGLVVGIAVTQIVAVALLSSADAPWKALVLLIGLGAAAAVMAWPRLGVYGLAAVLIGQWPWNLSRYAGAVALASGVVWVMRRRRPLIPRSPILALVGLYVVVVLVSTISPATRIHITTGAIAALSYLAVVWLCVILVDSQRAVRTLVGVMAISGVVSAIIGLIQAWVPFTWPASNYAVRAPYAFLSQGPILETHGWMGQFRQRLDEGGRRLIERRYEWVALGVRFASLLDDLVSERQRTKGLSTETGVSA